MAGQAKQGKMLEYAVINCLEDALVGNQQVIVVENGALNTAKNFYYEGTSELTAKMDVAAKAAIRALMKLEPGLADAVTEDVLTLYIQEDSKGIVGDVRDIVCLRKEPDWEFGISCKHNHSAVKHSRLSNNIDFGLKWFGIPCGEEYFNEISPIFKELEEMSKDEILFSMIKNKAERFYVPVINAFAKEISRLELIHGQAVPSGMLKYLLGRQDFYKIITNDAKRITKVEAYNLNGTLNLQRINRKAEVKTPILKLPERIYDISYKHGSKNTIIVTFDKGWAVSFRLHNAEKKVTSSLKFDINLLGIPHDLHTQTEAW